MITHDSPKAKVDVIYDAAINVDVIILTVDFVDTTKQLQIMAKDGDLYVYGVEAINDEAHK